MSAVIYDDLMLVKIQAITTYGLNLSTLIMHLYKNNYTPISTSVVGDFVECDFDGYAPLTVPLSWGYSGPVAGVWTIAIPPGSMLFGNTDGSIPNNIYGYYCTDSTGLFMELADRDPLAPFAMSTPGTTYTVDIAITDQAT